MTTKNQNLPPVIPDPRHTIKSKTVIQDGYEWTPRGGQLWGDYSTVTEYQGLKSLASARNYVCRYGIRTISHGSKKLINKFDLDRAAGLLPAEIDAA